MRPATAVLLLGLAACGPQAGEDSDSSSGDSSTGTTAASSTGEATEGTTGDPSCLSLRYPVGDDPFTDPSWQLGCGFPELCPGDGPIEFYIEGPLGQPSVVEVKEAERARCMATALRDREPGGFDFVVTGPGSEVQGIGGLEIVGEQAVARWRPATCDLMTGCEAYEALRQLAPKGKFTDCIHSDARALWLCLHEAVAAEPACLPGPLACS